MKPEIVRRMHYSTFETSIADKYGVIVENWPLDKFAAPGKFGTLVELRALYNAWKSGATRFRKLSREEFDARQRSLVERALAEAHAGNSVSGSEPMAVDGVPALAGAPATAPAATSTVPAAVTAPVPAVTAPVPAAVTAPAAAAPKKTRAPRKDKGTKRGPNARTRARQEAAANAQGGGQ